MKRYFLPLLILTTLLFACKKDIMENDQSATLHFSNDTITFDTVFASIGSITKTLTVYNRNNFDVKSNIALLGNSAAHFRMNIDGVAGNSQKNIEIPAKDSIFIFLEVTIDPSLNSTPYILSDSLVFTTGSKKQDVDIVAWGQDAYFHTANTYGNITSSSGTSRFYYHLLDCNAEWRNDKPHVVYGYVVVDPGCELNIYEGSNIYFHKNSGIIIGNPFDTLNSGGSLKIHGTLGNEVTFQGDRLDSWYENLPGQWDRIWLMPGSIDNKIDYAIIRNGNIGIHADTVGNSGPTVIINNTIIENMSSIGILGQGANVEANNTVVSKCGQYTVACNIGGTYNFTHCTFANYWDYNHRSTPSILLNNYYEDVDGNINVRDLLAANFTNCIIDGSLSTEVSFQEKGQDKFNYTFDHCLIKLDPTIDTDNAHYESVIINQSPKFKDNTESDFHLTENSPAIDAGNNSTDGTSDIEGKDRNTPDIGAFEF